MRRALITTAGVSLLSLVTSISCNDESNRCDTEPQNYSDICSAQPMLDFAVITQRLAKTGGAIKLRAKNLPAGTAITGTLGSIQLTFPAPSGTDGTTEVMLSAAQLQALTLGKNIVTVKAGSKSDTKTIRLYAPPKFDSTDLKTGMANDPVTWLAINVDASSTLSLFSFEQFDAMTKNFQRYPFQMGGALGPAGGISNPLRNSLSAVDIVDFSSDQVFRLRSTLGKPPFTLERTAINASTQMYSTIAMPNFSSPRGITAARPGGLIAVAGEGVDGPVKVWSLPSGTASPTALSFDSAPTKQVRLLGAGRLNDDALPDIVLIHDDNTSSVYTSGTGTALVLDKTLSGGLSTANKSLPKAVFITDLDRDQLDDVLVIRADRIELLANEGDGTFTATSLLQTATEVVTAGDVNGDSTPDLVVASGKNISVYLNRAN